MRRALLALLLAASTARAGGVADEAELHFQIATERYIARDFRAALEHFLFSNRLVPNKNVVFNIARTFEQLGRFADAHRYYVEALEGETDPKVRSGIEASIARIAPNVAILDVHTEPPGGTIYIDRRDLGSRGVAPRPLALPAGKYKVIAELAGHEPAESAVLAAELGKTVRVELALKKIVGTVKIEAEPGTAVHLDDESAPIACTAPCELERAPGAYALHLTREGFQTAVRQVSIAAWATASVRATLAPLTGSLVVSADEREALVEIDDRSVGFTPAVVREVAVGERRVRVSLRGFVPIERVVVVKANEQTELVDLRLEPLREVTAASRYTESVEDAPGSVTVISAEELRAFASPTIAEALRGIRGISLSNDAIYSSIAVRGIGQPNDYGNRLLVLSDGMVLNDNIVSSSYVGYDGRVDLLDVERIEIVRGAGSVLYGTGAISGVVNLVTRPRDSASSVHVSGGTADHSVARVRGGFYVDAGNDSGLWASVAFARSDGRTVTLGAIPGTSTGSTTPGIDKFTAATAAGRAWWGPLTAQWLYTTRDQSTPIGAYGTVFGDPDSRSADRRAMGELRYEPSLGSFGQLLLRAHANLYTFEGDFIYEDEETAEEYRGMWFGAEGRLVMTPLDDPRALRISAGATAERHTQAALEGTSGDGESFIDEDHPYTLGAAYLLAESSPAAWVRISAGARLDSYSTFGVSVNPRLSVIFRPSEDGVLKIFGGRAFRAPSVYELYYNDGGLSQVPNPDLRPETSYSGEIEYSHRIFRDWTVLGAIHANYLEDIIETRGEGTEESPLIYTNAEDPVLAAGAELEVRREWRQGWMFGASYGYQRARYRERTGAEARLINAPEHLGSLRGAAPIVPGIAVLAGRLSIEGPRRISLDDDQETEPAVVTDAIVSGEVTRYDLRYSAGVYNLFDWRYDVPITEGAPSSTLIQQGRTFLFQLTVDLTM
jgi:outer membrane receptor protein involved in Fe transport